MTRLGMALLLLWAPLAAAAKVKPPRDAGRLASMARHYVSVEHHIAASTRAVPSKELYAHWDELHALSIAIVRLERRGDLKKLKEGRRVTLRHVLGQLLGEDNEIALDNDDPKLQKAHFRKSEDLHALSTVAQRAFDIATADANGSWSPG